MKKPNFSANEESTQVYIAVGIAILCYAITFVTLYPKYDASIGNFMILPITVAAWTRHKKGGLITALITWGLSIVIVLQLDVMLKDYLLNTFTIFLGALSFLIAVGVGQISLLSHKLEKETSKRKELQSILKERSILIEELLSKTGTFEKRQKADFESNISTLKAQLETPKN